MATERNVDHWSSTEIRADIGLFFECVEAGPVYLTSYRKVVAVALSIDEYRRLRTIEAELGERK